MALVSSRRPTPSLMVGFLQEPDNSRRGEFLECGPDLSGSPLSHALTRPRTPDGLEIPLALFVTAIAIEFDCVAGTFARRTAILCAWLRFASARWVLTFLSVRHDASLVLPTNLLENGRRA
jgi:hypothetical protein